MSRRVAATSSARYSVVSTQCWDPDIGCTLVAATPTSEPDLWSEYLSGAVESYRRFGVESVLQIDQVRSGVGTALFFAVVDESGRVVGGVRAQGPYQSVGETHAVAEWEGRRGLATVRQMITDRIPFGVAEMKAAWATGNTGTGSSVTTALARTAVHTMALLPVRFVMATSATHVLNRWGASGGVVASDIPGTPYPDERYDTRIMWWDRHTFLRHADPVQVPKILAETAVLAEMTQRHEEASSAMRLGRW